MRKNSFLLLCTVILSTLAFELLAGTTARSQVGEDSIKSKVLNVTRKYTVCLPESYATATGKKYPVLYLLHGHSHRNNDWVRDGKIRELVDQLTGTNEACEMIIIMPDGGSIKNGYFDVKGWNYETFFFEEFLPFVEKKYRVNGDQSGRAIAGFSMGGGGAVAYALKHPDLFSSVYAMSSLMTLPRQDRTPVRDPKMEEFGKSVLANDCNAYVAYADEATLEKLRGIRWFVDCGDDDFLLEVNCDFYREMQ
ncbi:MAG: alpha/beta hydrolase-fold protein, partial [Mangrovibacterium sp.]|nr:alpha/beta hydrolase-fold protein [Mangrovibacterium sp.]